MLQLVWVWGCFSADISTVALFPMIYQHIELQEKLHKKVHAEDGWTRPYPPADESLKALPSS